MLVHMQPTYPIIYAGHTDVGKKRGHNEDSYLVDPERGLAIVADGMGGHQAGEVASGMLVDIFSKEIENLSELPPGKRLQTLIEMANEQIFKESQESSEKQGMGTTVISIHFSNSGYHVINVGDSRAYLLRQREIIQISDDHSFVQLQVQMGLLTKEDSRHSRLRHILTRSIGGQPVVESDLYEDSVASGDLFLLCSDGFHQGFEDEEIREMLLSGPDDLNSLASHIVEQANERDGSDNITVILARLG